MQTASYQRILQSCRCAIDNEEDIIEEMPIIEESDPSGIIRGVRQLQAWIRQTTWQAEFQVHYQMGRALSINQTYKQQRRPATALTLNGRERTMAARTYLLFRDHIGAIAHLKGIKVNDIRSMTQKNFDDLLYTLEGEYPPFIDFGDEPLLWIDPTGEEELELDEWDL